MYVSSSKGPGAGIPIICWLDTSGGCSPGEGVSLGVTSLYSGPQGADDYFYGIDIANSNSLSSYQNYTINWMGISDYPPSGVMPSYIVGNAPFMALPETSINNGWEGDGITFPSPVPLGPQVYSNGTTTAELTNAGVYAYTQSGSYLGYLQSSKFGWNGYGINP
jgi:hypothetical protein